MSRAVFNTMNRYEFASDTYASLIVEHHFDGFFLNHIPLLRKLKWREVAIFKAVMGGMSANNREADRLNAWSPQSGADVYTGFRSPSSKPFLEAGVGIENILQVIRVDALWRLNYLDNPEASRFTLVFGAYFNF
ncbi:MAG: carboxypeptidase-like regulatory domain-containing protein, partial [Saprospiraceae bacterium]